MGVSQVHQTVIQMEKWSQMMFADWQDCVLAVWKALSVYLDKMAPVLGTGERESFVTCHNCFRTDHILAIVAHNLQIIGLHWLLVENCCVSCWMENTDTTGNILEMATVKEGNHTHAVDNGDQCVSHIDCTY